MKHHPMETFVKFPSMEARVSIQASKEAGGGRFDLDGRGMMVFALRATEVADVMSVRVHDLRINFQPARFEFPELGPVEIPGFTVTECDLDPTRTQGTWHRAEKAVKLELAVRLNPDHIPVMRELGFTETVTVLAVESGKLDWERGRHLETHAEPFTLPYPLNFLTVSPGQFDRCAVQADLRLATDCNLAKEFRETEIWICPGDEACLVWEVSGNPTSVTLNPLGSVGDSGNQIVTPTSTTTYRLTGKDPDCEDSDQVTVRVVREGESIFSLSANWNPWANCIWQYELPAALVGKSVMAVAMRHVKCAGGTSIWPQWAYTHTDPDGNFFSGNVELDTWGDITDQRLAGIWKFSPIGFDICRPPEGSSGFVPQCFELRLGCR